MDAPPTAVSRLVLALDRAGGVERGAKRLSGRLASSRPYKAPMTDLEVIAFELALEVVSLWESMRPWERKLVNEALDEAGVPRIAS